MVIDKVIVIVAVITLLLALSVKYVKKCINKNLVVISLLSFTMSIYIILTISGIYIPLYVQISVLIFSFLVPLFFTFLQYNDIAITKKILYYNAKISYMTNDYEKSIKYIQKLINKYEKTADILFMKGMCYQKLNDTIMARDAFVETISVDPFYYKAYYELGIILDYSNEPERAIEMYRKAVSIKPDFYEAEEALGISYTNSGNYREAVKIYRCALKYHPNSYEIYYNIGMIELEQGNYDDAKEAFRNASKIKPDLYTAYYNLGNIEYLNGDLDEAINDYRKVLKSVTYASKSYYKIALCYATKKEFEKAMGSLEYAIELDNNIINNLKNEIVFDGMKDLISDYLADRQILDFREKNSKNYMMFEKVEKLEKNEKSEVIENSEEINETSKVSENKDVKNDEIIEEAKEEENIEKIEVEANN